VRVFWANLFHFEKISDTTTVYYMNKILITVFTKEKRKEKQNVGAKHAHQIQLSTAKCESL